jgi:hypothetical protein
MAKTKADHVVMRNGAVFCLHCGREQKIAMPCEISVFSAMAKAFTKSHAKCLKTWEEPQADQTQSEKVRMAFWLQNGERGISSETMYHVLSGGKPGPRACHPWDPSDFRRCYLLLKTVPEWKEKLHLLKPLSESWANLVDNWDKLTEMLEEQMKTKRANGMYEFMQTLIDK